MWVPLIKIITYKTTLDHIDTRNTGHSRFMWAYPSDINGVLFLIMGRIFSNLNEPSD